MVELVFARVYVSPSFDGARLSMLDLDYRGSRGYAAIGELLSYRHMGGKDLTDYVDASAYLVAEHGVDPVRIGLYGGSYGGLLR